MGHNFARNWLVPLSGRYSGTYVYSPASNIDKDPYKLSPVWGKVRCLVENMCDIDIEWKQAGAELCQAQHSFS